MSIVVTTGNTYIDIDGLACVIAYRELLKHENRVAIALLQATWNYTIPQGVREWDLKFEKEYTPQSHDRYVVMDISDTDYIHNFLSDDKIVELYDHHFGFEKYWAQKLGNNAHIEKVGSCATLVIEQWRRRLPRVEFSAPSANLLGLSIISNTLNFQSLVTDKRDQSALEYVLPLITLGDTWIDTYFEERDAYIYSHPESSILNDTKKLTTLLLQGELAIAQLELWEGSMFIPNNMSTIQKILQSSQAPHWLLTVVSMKDGHNYLYTTSQALKDVLQEKIGATFEGNKGTTRTLLLRKEILRELKA